MNMFDDEDVLVIDHAGTLFSSGLDTVEGREYHATILTNLAQDIQNRSDVRYSVQIITCDDTDVKLTTLGSAGNTLVNTESNFKHKEHESAFATYARLIDASWLHASDMGSRVIIEHRDGEVILHENKREG